MADSTAPAVEALVQDLTDTASHWRDATDYGRAIAAPQIGAGALQQVILLRLPGKPAWPLVNPNIVARSSETMVVWDASKR
ncbi:peptide deformylase [Hymenobacter sp. CRA2]|uniref:peptide deformylase n=1 Tax=Hymenobacter sp. CRA2 TaxID=1955620 RepID=UPI001590BD26|nr:peptide deformylase [Hymenobacter sp. CRA2]